MKWLSYQVPRAAAQRGFPFQAMSALEEAGVRVPEDVSVVGIDNIAFAGLARPSLTTINVPREELGLTACRALEKMMQLKRHGGGPSTPWKPNW